MSSMQKFVNEDTFLCETIDGWSVNSASELRACPKLLVNDQMTLPFLLFPVGHLLMLNASIASSHYQRVVSRNQRKHVGT